MAKEMAMTKVESSSTGTKVKRGILGVIINFALWFFSLTCIFSSDLDVVLFPEDKESV